MLQEHKDYIEKMIFGNEIDDTLPAIATMLEQIVTKKKPTFDSNGLSYDLDFLEEVSYGILVLPIDIQSHFVDEQTAMLVNNNQLIMEDDLSEDIIGSESIARQLDENLVNATSIGNIAYVYQYTKDARTKEIAKQWITAFAEQVLIKFSKNNNK